MLYFRTQQGNNDAENTTIFTKFFYSVFTRSSNLTSDNLTADVVSPLKRSEVPVHKSRDKNLVNNYRPISLLCNTSKVLEKLVYDKIINFVSKSISSVQFVALKGKSTLQLLVILDFIYSNSSDQVDVIYLDIKKAFDSIPHNKLLSKLYSHGIRGSGLRATWREKLSTSISTNLFLLLCWFFLEFPKRVFWDPYCS